MANEPCKKWTPKTADAAGEEGMRLRGRLQHLIDIGRKLMSDVPVPDWLKETQVTVEAALDQRDRSNS